AYPNNVKFKNGLAISFSKLGQTHTSLGNLDSALIFFNQSSLLVAQLFEAYPNNVEFKNNLAISYEKLGQTHTSLGNLDSALIFFNERSRLGKELFEAYPNNVKFKNGLAISYAKLGRFYKSLTDYKASLQNFENARILWTELVEDAPQIVQFEKYLSMVEEDILEIQLAPIIKLNKQIEASRDSSTTYLLYGKLCDSVEAKMAIYPELGTYLSQYLNSKAWYGLFLGKFEASEKDLRKGMALPFENPYLHTNLAPALLLQGKFKEAKAEYIKWKDKPFPDEHGKTYRNIFLDDLKVLEEAGIIQEKVKGDVDKIKELLNP
ncbi:MAG: hypothetical protein MRZ79_09935, partial [Bacteroidia bacterium]|nr:hypothetical protein [Bacteroidia bacterium]